MGADVFTPVIPKRSLTKQPTARGIIFGLKVTIIEANHSMGSSVGSGGQ